MATILLADDDSIIQTLTQEILHALGHTMLHAETGDEARKIVCRHKNSIDLILLDLYLPDANGIDLIPEFLAEKPGLRIAICTGSILAKDQLTYLAELGVRDFLPKPFHVDELKLLLDSLV